MALSDSRFLLPSLQILVPLLFQFLSILIPLASPLSFNFSGNRLATPNLRYQADAFFDGTVIQLTKNQADSSPSSLQRSVGRVTYPEPVLFYDDAAVINFSSCFSFRMGDFNSSASADGLAFFLSPYPSEIPENSYGGTLGLFSTFGANKTRNNTVVAVEFDSFKNVEYNDSSSNHVGIDVHTIFSVAHADLNASIRQQVFDACVGYDGGAKNLSVFLRDTLDSSRHWSTSYVVDLREVLPDKGSIGFSAATGNKIESHRILYWNFSSTDLDIHTNSSRKKYEALASVVGAGVVAFGFASVCFCTHRACKKGSTGKEQVEMAVAIDSLINKAFERSAGSRRFPYGVLASATRDFAEEGKLGEGGFGGVYMGVLQGSGLQVAVKRISRGSKQGTKEYISEVTIISRLRHRNLVQLVGYCHEKGDLLLVYEYMPNKSLDYHLYHKEKLLAWPTRYNIALGLASALLYLHEEWEQCVVHRDVKPSNVMLDSEFNAKLGDFGLARLVDHDCDPATTVLAGTRGYMAPEYAFTGKACKESDVYSFGVVILEIACGRKPIAVKYGEVNLVEWVWELYGKGMHLNAADERFKMKFDKLQMECLLIVGLWCTQLDYELRPSIRQAINVLKFDAPLPILSPNMPLPVFLRPPPVDISNLCSTPNSIKSEG
ncbi:L-type lectin-domain containing receptor kinase IX.1-like [Phoenix dactylifera]|uniref:non-specific serine/threonine protein kinase n=1 Tax=Phoenix dactylifera TaxID=42345 RepID=A0A8B7C8K1_PHODC|nr:L-type lectin-domain containing receptor kinase IX.1-like [Phoenix dactylifera]